MNALVLAGWLFPVVLLCVAALAQDFAVSIICVVLAILSIVALVLLMLLRHMQQQPHDVAPFASDADSKNSAPPQSAPASQTARAAAPVQREEQLHPAALQTAAPANAPSPPPQVLDAILVRLAAIEAVQSNILDEVRTLARLQRSAAEPLPVRPATQPQSAPARRELADYGPQHPPRSGAVPAAMTGADEVPPETSEAYGSTALVPVGAGARLGRPLAELDGAATSAPATLSEHAYLTAIRDAAYAALCESRTASPGALRANVEAQLARQAPLALEKLRAQDLILCAHSGSGEFLPDFAAPDFFSAVHRKKGDGWLLPNPGASYKYTFINAYEGTEDRWPGFLRAADCRLDQQGRVTILRMGAL